MTATEPLNTRFAAAQQIADAVLWEGYVLYPYRASAVKNHLRWQFGVLTPRTFAQAEGERWRMQTECLVEPLSGTTPRVDVRVRFLHLQARTVERADGDRFTPVDALAVSGREIVAWDEAVAVHRDLPDLDLAALVAEPRVEAVAVPGDRRVDAVHDDGGTCRGRVVRTRHPLQAQVVAGAEAVDGLVRLRLEVRNTARDGGGGDRGVALRRSLLGAHTLVAVTGGRFLSLTDPPATAREAAAGCTNEHTWPVLAGPGGRADLLLSSPIILPDHPVVAPESPGETFDGTEIDELLTLRVQTLTEREKAEARATDERAEAIVERSDTLPAAHLERLHGALRASGLAPAEAVGDLFAPSTPYWAPEAEVAPEDAAVSVDGIEVSRGSRVRLRPGPHGDTMDVFLAGRSARVEAVYTSVDHDRYVAVTVDDDPAAALHGSAGRFFYFRPHELEPLTGAEGIGS